MVSLSRRQLLGAAALAVPLKRAASPTEPDTGIGTAHPAEWKTIRDPETGRAIRQLTSARANSYPLYYFIPAITADNRYLIFHSERSGWVQLYRLDLGSGEIVQLTAGRTRDSGWAIWCEHHLRGVYNHLSALSLAKREVYYFQDFQIRSVHVETLADRLVYELPGRIPVGQAGFAPDGRYFSFIHAGFTAFKQAIADREALLNMGQFTGAAQQQWRNRAPTTIGLLDTTTGKYKDVIALDYHVHHVTFLDNDRIVVNHIKDGNGPWMIRRDGTGLRVLRPRDEHGSIIHQLLTDRGMYYEAVGSKDGKRVNYLGRYNLQTGAYREIPTPADGYVHTGFDAAGKFLFLENHGSKHQLVSVHFPLDPSRTRIGVLRTMAPYPARGGQRYHAHPFLAPDRKWVYYTEVVDGVSQVCALDVNDVADLNEYWS